MRYTHSMQCLRCENEALPGKALCAICFASHQKKVEFEETDDWVKQQLEATRNESRAKQRDAKGAQTSPHSLVLTLAPALLALGGFVMFSVWAMRNMSFSFSPTPESEQAAGAPGSPANGGAAAANGTRQEPGRQPGGENSSGGSRPADSAPEVRPTATPTNTPTVTPTALAAF